MKIKLILGFLVLVCLIVFGIFFLAPTSQGQKEQNANEQPTVVKRGEVTRDEREYSKEYAMIYSFRHGRKFSDLIEENERLGKGNEPIRGFLGERETFFLPDTPVITSAEFLNHLSCNSDAIIIGFVKGKTSHMTEDETFIYTEYELSIDTVLKDNATSPIKSNTNIRTSRPGGSVMLDNRTITIEDRSFEPLQTGKTYMLFLRYVPSVEGYMSAGLDGDFVLEDTVYRNISKRPSPASLRINIEPADLQNLVRSAVLAPCDQKTAGGKK
jgi:hypothetical protein